MDIGHCSGSTIKLVSLIEGLVEIKNIISLFAASGVRGGHRRCLYRIFV